MLTPRSDSFRIRRAGRGWHAISDSGSTTPEAAYRLATVAPDKPAYPGGLRGSAATASCINPGGKHPQATNKTGVFASGTFPVHNGKANVRLTVTATFHPIAWRR